MALTRSTVAAMAAGAVLTLGVGGAALAVAGSARADSTPSPSASSGPGAAPGQRPGPGHGRGGDLLGGPAGGRVLHGEVVVQNESGSGTTQMLVQQGAVTSKSGSTVTVRSTDGYTITWTVDAATKGTLTDVAVGDQVHAAGTRTGDSAAKATLIGEKGTGMPGPRGDRRQGLPGQDGRQGPSHSAPSSTGSGT